MNREWESIRLWSKVERLSGQGPRTMCQLWQCFREFCVSSVPVRRATDCTSQEFKQRWLGRTRFQNGFVFFEEGLSGDFSRHTQCRGGATYGQKRKKPDDIRESSEEESTNLLVFPERSRRPNSKKPSGSHKVFFTVTQRSELWSL